VHPNVLWPTSAEARSAERGDISLALCDGCGLIWNTRFDPGVLAYDGTYENSLHFSGEFQRYSRELIGRLTHAHDVAGGRVAELGCGKGEFLAQLCETAGCTGIGFDPSYAGESDGRAAGRLSFVRELFGPDSDLDGATLVVCRHVLEHLEDPVEVLALVRRALGDTPATLYVEVPSGEYLLREAAIWDVIYPHVTCFTGSALAEVLQRSGFHPTNHGYSFGGQYLWMEASNIPAGTSPTDGALGSATTAAIRFGDRLAAKVEGWSNRLELLLAEQSVVVWGAGAKGTTFLNAIAAGESVEYVVDVNPRKHGKYVPGTGQRIVAPESLSEQQPGTVVVMNPIYSDEIRQALRELGCNADLVVA
jgi:SAM-dependent methyltransferase